MVLSPNVGTNLILDIYPIPCTSGLEPDPYGPSCEVLTVRCYVSERYEKGRCMDGARRVQCLRYL
jgi:hypothetical protein